MSSPGRECGQMMICAPKLVLGPRIARARARAGLRPTENGAPAALKAN